MFRKLCIDSFGSSGGTAVAACTTGRGSMLACTGTPYIARTAGAPVEVAPGAAEAAGGAGVAAAAAAVVAVVAVARGGWSEWLAASWC